MRRRRAARRGLEVAPGQSGRSEQGLVRILSEDACGVFVTGGTRVGGTCRSRGSSNPPTPASPSTAVAVGPVRGYRRGLTEPTTNGGGGGDTVIHVPSTARGAAAAVSRASKPRIPTPAPGRLFTGASRIRR